MQPIIYITFLPSGHFCSTSESSATIAALEGDWLFIQLMILCFSVGLVTFLRIEEVLSTQAINLKFSIQLTQFMQQSHGGIAGSEACTQLISVAQTIFDPQYRRATNADKQSSFSMDQMLLLWVDSPIRNQQFLMATFASYCQQGEYIIDILVAIMLQRLWLYQLLKSYFCHCLALFYRPTHLIGVQNIPQQGPVILYGNHRNYVVDGLNLMMAVKRPVRLIVAASSVRQPGIGHFIRGLDVIGVERVQDVEEKKGRGRIVAIKDGVVTGQGTTFRQLTAGSTLNVDGHTLTVKHIHSDTQLETHQDTLTIYQCKHDYTFKAKINYQQFFSQACTALNNGECIAIFPQGTSHDNLQMKPFKAGIANMALQALQQYGTNVKFVPCAFSLYKQHLFRSKVAIKFGQAVTIPEGIVQMRKGSKKEGVAELLLHLRSKLDQLTLEFDSQEELPALMLARQLYTLNKHPQMPVDQKLALDRKFARGYMQARSKPKYRQTYHQLLQFAAFLQREGISVRNTPFSTYGITFSVKLCALLIKIVLCAVLMVPGFFLWGWLAYSIKFYVDRERRYWKRVSRPLDSNNYFVAGYKIFYGCILLPAASIIYSILAYHICIQFHLSTITSLCMGLTFLGGQYIYGYLFVSLYDKLVHIIAQLRFIALKLLKTKAYFYFLAVQDSLEGAIRQIAKQVEQDTDNDEWYPQLESKKVKYVA